MRSGNHHSGNGLLEPDCIAEFRSRPDILEEEDVHPVGAEHVCCYPGKKLAVVPAVIRDADSDVISVNRLAISIDTLCGMCLDILGKALCGHTHSVLVHPVGADAHDASEATGTKLEIAVECILESCRVIVPQLDDLTFSLGIEIPVEPALGYISKIFCHSLCDLSWFIPLVLQK